MKKTIALILALLFVSAAFAGCADSGKQKFVLGFDKEFPPYGYVDENGNYAGFDLDLAAELCSRKGWQLELKPIDWKAKDSMLESGAIDCIWNGFTYNGRENDYTWTVPYVDNSQVVVVKADSGITGLSALAGKKVAVQAASSALDAINSEDKAELKASFAQIIEYPDYNAAFMNLEMGAVDAVALDIGVAKYQLKSRGDTFVMLEELISTEQYAVGFKLGNTALRDAVQETLLAMASDGKFAEIAEKYSDYGIPSSVCLGTESN